MGTYIKEADMYLQVLDFDRDVVRSNYDKMCEAIALYKREIAPLLDEVRGELTKISRAYHTLYGSSGSVYEHPKWKRWEHIRDSLEHPRLVVHWSDSDQHGNSYSAIRPVLLYIRSSEQFPFRGYIKGDPVNIGWY
jgi:hypothetical protein